MAIKENHARHEARITQCVCRFGPKIFWQCFAISEKWSWSTSWKYLTISWLQEEMKKKKTIVLKELPSSASLSKQKWFNHFSSPKQMKLWHYEKVWRSDIRTWEGTYGHETALRVCWPYVPSHVSLRTASILFKCITHIATLAALCPDFLSHNELRCSNAFTPVQPNYKIRCS